MAKGDPPLLALKKAIKKLENVQRNLGEAGCQDQVWECIRLKESWIKVYERMGGEWNLTDAEWEKWAQAVSDAQAAGKKVTDRFTVFRKPCLPEDEGRMLHLASNLSRHEADDLIHDSRCGGFFHESDFTVTPTP